MALSGQRRRSEDTRGRILEAARTEFAARGYRGATIRGIARRAGVDPALVHHYFGPKEDLFRSVIHLPLAPAQVAEAVFGEGLAGAGERMARLFLSVWETPQSRDALVALLRGAFSAEQGASTLRDFFESVLAERFAARLEGPQAVVRASLVASHLVGLAVLRYVIRFEALASADVEELVALVAPRLQSYFDGQATGS